MTFKEAYGAVFGKAADSIMALLMPAPYGQTIHWIGARTAILSAI